jgi:hypothetical protein
MSNVNSLGCRLPTAFANDARTIRVAPYAGYAERWDTAVVDGSPAAKNCKVTYSLGGKTLAVATNGWPRKSLVAETELERS